MKYEYRTVVVPLQGATMETAMNLLKGRNSAADRTQKALDQMAADGWRFVSSLPLPSSGSAVAGGVVLIFEREVP
jgi:Domain of unknown function (DUF4177)